MAKFEKELATLKEKLITAEDFHEVYTYFFDHLGENPDFIKLGKRSKNPLLKRVLEAVGEQLFKKKVKVTKLLLTKLPRHSFYHGPCFINGRMAGVLFFKDIDMGMLSVLMSLETHTTNFVRFSSVEVESGGDRFLCSPRSKTIH